MGPVAYLAAITGHENWETMGMAWWGKVRRLGQYPTTSSIHQRLAPYTMPNGPRRVRTIEPGIVVYTLAPSVIVRVLGDLPLQPPGGAPSPAASIGDLPDVDYALVVVDP
jgi:hypothetical protein